MSTIAPRHDATYSPEVVRILRDILTNDANPIQGPIVDPFAGLGLSLTQLGRDDITGIEIEPAWANTSPLVTQGDALDPDAYPQPLGAIATSPCYGNRLSDQYLGAPCTRCDGLTTEPTPPEPTLEAETVNATQITCRSCKGTGRDPKDQKRRFSYAISLGHPVHEQSAASLPYHNDHRGFQYRNFHQRWLYTINQLLEPGPNRLILNIKDHYRTTTTNGKRAQRRQYACDWWLHAAHQSRFRLTTAIPAYTQGIGYGANMQTSKADHEMVFVFDLTAT